MSEEDLEQALVNCGLALGDEETADRGVEKELLKQFLFHKTQCDFLQNLLKKPQTSLPDVKPIQAIFDTQEMVGRLRTWVERKVKVGEEEEEERAEADVMEQALQ